MVTIRSVQAGEPFTLTPPNNPHTDTHLHIHGGNDVDEQSIPGGTDPPDNPEHTMTPLKDILAWTKADGTQKLWELAQILGNWASTTVQIGHATTHKAHPTWLTH